MSHSAEEEEREQFQSFMDQIRLLRADLKAAEDMAHVELHLSKKAMEQVLQRVVYTLREYY